MLVLFLGYQMDIITAAILSVIAVGIVMPLISRFSRIAWLHIDYRADEATRTENGL